MKFGDAFFWNVLELSCTLYLCFLSVVFEFCDSVWIVDVGIIKIVADESSGSAKCGDQVFVVPTARLTPQNKYILIINTTLEARTLI